MCVCVCVCVVCVCCVMCVTVCVCVCGDMYGKHVFRIRQYVWEICIKDKAT